MRQNPKVSPEVVARVQGARERLSHQTFSNPVAEPSNPQLARTIEGVAVSHAGDAAPTALAQANGYFRVSDFIHGSEPGTQSRRAIYASHCVQVRRHVGREGSKEVQHRLDEIHLEAAELFRADWEAAGAPQRMTVKYEARETTGEFNPNAAGMRLERLQSFQRACQALGEWAALTIAVCCHDESAGSFVQRDGGLPLKKAQAAGLYSLKKALETLIKFYELEARKK